MKIKEGFIRGFHSTAKAWYGPANQVPSERSLEELSIGYYTEDDDGGTLGEFEVVWVSLGNNRFAPQLQVFDDGWKILYEDFHDLLEAMVDLADKEQTDVESFISMLKLLGIKDLTAYKRRG